MLKILKRLFGKSDDVYYPITKNVSVNKNGKIFFSDEEIESARRRVEEMEEIERELFEYRSQTEYSTSTIHTKLGDIVEHYHYNELTHTEKIPRA